MPRLIVIRHGNTFDKGDTVTRVGARTDLPLSRSGEAQAQALAQHFANTPLIAAFCSPLLRTRQTARSILQLHRPAPALCIKLFLTEIDYGPDENQPEDKVIARLGSSAIEAWDASATPPPGWQVDPHALIDSWKDLLRAASKLPEDATALIVTSNGIARFLLDAVNELPDDTPRKLKTGAWGEVAITRSGTSTLKAWNLRPNPPDATT